MIKGFRIRRTAAWKSSKPEDKKAAVVKSYYLQDRFSLLQSLRDRILKNED